MLYTLSHSPARCNLSGLLRLMVKDDVLILIQDGVLAGLDGSFHYELLCSIPISIYALQDDLVARGLIGYLSQKIMLIGYNYFVELTEYNYRQMAW